MVLFDLNVFLPFTTVGSRVLNSLCLADWTGDEATRIDSGCAQFMSPL